jgi:hypothetical protein
MASEGRTLGLTCGMAQRVYADVAKLAKLAGELGPAIALQGNAVLEELDLLRFLLREATLQAVIAPAGTLTPDRPQAPRSASTAPAKPQAAGGRARAAKLAPAKRKAIAEKAAKARWGRKQ